MSPFRHRSIHVSDINLIETRRKTDHLLLPSTEPGPRFGGVGTSHFFRLETITLRVSPICVSYLNFLHSVLVALDCSSPFFLYQDCVCSVIFHIPPRRKKQIVLHQEVACFYTERIGKSFGERKYIYMKNCTVLGTVLTLGKRL
jgi:hypothetical protein